MITKVLFVFGVVATGACARDAGTSTPSLLLAERANAPADIQRDCDTATRRCSRCHPLDRILNTRVGSPGEWQTYARRMRLQPGSGIPPREEPAIVRCLVYRSFGPEGLRKMSSASEGTASEVSP